MRTKEEIATDLTALVADIQSIQIQLGKRRVKRTMSSEERGKVEAWRNKAKHALDLKQKQLASVKAEKRQFEAAKRLRVIEDTGPALIVENLYRTVKRLVRDGATLTLEEQQNVDLSQLYLRGIENGEQQR